MGFFEIFSSALAAFYAIAPSYGLAIILVTLLVRVLLLPLSIRQTRSMREMQRIQPEIKRLQSQHKGDRQKLNEEMMKLYKEHSVNPFGGCFPLLLQFPALIGLFYVIRAPLGYMGYRLNESSDWVPVAVSGIMARIQDSSLAQALTDRALEVNHFILGLRLDCSAQAALTGDGTPSVPQACGSGLVSAVPYLGLVLFMGATTYYQQKQMQASTQSAGGAQNAQMQAFTRILPFMLMFFSFSFPTGVVLYWLTTNVWMIVQQQVVLRAAPPVPTAGDGAAPRPGAPPAARGPAKGSRPESAAPGSSNGGSRARPPTKSPHARKKKRKR